MSTPNDPYQSGQNPYGEDPFRKDQNGGQYDPNAGQYDPYGQPPSYPAQPYPAAQQYPGQQFPGQYPGYPSMPPGEMQDPDNALGIVGLVLNFVCCGPIGLVVSWIALKKSKERGYKNTVALVGAILGGISTALLLIVGIFYLVVLVIAISSADSGTYLMSLL